MSELVGQNIRSTWPKVAKQEVTIKRTTTMSLPSIHNYRMIPSCDNEIAYFEMEENSKK